MRYYRRKEFEVTIREVLFSVLFLGVMVSIGFFISNGIHNFTTEENEKYYKALKIDDDSTVFSYSLKTGIGSSLTYGEFKANKPVSDENIKGEYFYIEKVKEKYTMHTETVSYKCGKSTCTRTETYWTWDYVDSEEFYTDSFNFMGNNFSYDLIKFNNTEYLETVTFGDIRYVYNVIPKEFKGTLYSNLKNNSINDNQLFANQTIKEVMNNKVNEADYWVVVFWILWIILSLILVAVFIALDNKYLNGH